MPERRIAYRLHFGEHAVAHAMLVERSVTLSTRRDDRMFANHVQAARACRALLAQARLEHLWTAQGPTTDAIDLLKRDGGKLPRGDRFVFLAAWGFWDRTSTRLRLCEMFDALDLGRLQALCSLMLAVTQGTSYVDEWLETYGLTTDRA